MKPLKWIWLFWVPLCAQDTDRNFTGTWRLKDEVRHFGTLPASPASVLQIRHEGISIHCSNAPGETPEHGCAAYNTDRSEARTDWKRGSISSRAKWEGRALLINSIVSGPRSYTRMDRWTLSNDRNTLRIRRQIVGRYGEAESTLVYEREPEAEPVRNAVSPPAVSASMRRFTRVPSGRLPLRQPVSIRKRAKLFTTAPPSTCKPNGTSKSRSRKAHSRASYWGWDIRTQRLCSQDRNARSCARSNSATTATHRSA